MLIDIPDVLGRSELRDIDALLVGGNYVDGRSTAGFRAKRVKNNLQMDKGDGNAARIKSIVLDALRRNETFRRAALPATILPPIVSRYERGMNYGPHVDDALMRHTDAVRTDVSVTVFLNDSGAYEGGELVIRSAFGVEEVKLPRGAAVIYPSSTLHHVAPVERGTRIAAVTWAQSHVRDPARRELLHDLDRVRRKLAALLPDDEETDLAFKCYGNLLRMWVDA